MKDQSKKDCDEKIRLNKEVQKSSDFIMAVQEKCNQSNQQALSLLGSLKDADAEIESLKV